MLKKKTKWIIAAAGILLAGTAVAFSRGGNDFPTYSSVQVVRQDLKQSVQETGSVRADLELNYGWEIPGRVTYVYKKVGDTVTSGVVIAELQNTTQRAELAEAQSRLASARAAVSLEYAGPSEERKQQSKAEVAQAQANLDEARVELAATTLSAENAILSAENARAQAEATLQNQEAVEQQVLNAAYEDALQQAQTSVLQALDALVTASNIQYTYGSLSGNSQTALAFARKKGIAVELLVGARNAGKWQADSIVAQRGGVRAAVETEFDRPVLDYENIEKVIDEVLTMLGAVDRALDDLLYALNAEETATSVDLAELSTERTTIDAAMSATVNAKQAIANARVTNKSASEQNRLKFEKAKEDLAHAKRKATQDIAASEALVNIRQAALTQAEAAYAVLIAPPRDVDTASLRADVSRELANVQRMQHLFDQTMLRALSNGVLSKLDVEVGETVTAQQPIVSLISSELGVDVDISEADIADISVGDTADITLDAFGEDTVIQGRVVSIEPAETEISGVIYYKTEISFSAPENLDVRSGMTANVEIHTDERKGVLAIPERAVTRTGTVASVRVVTDKKSGAFEERTVTTGLKGNDGLIEITGGLEEGETIITFIETEKE